MSESAATVIDEVVKKQPKKGCLSRLWSKHLLWFLVPLAWFYWDMVRVVPIRISPETTYITSPLTADGKRVDYFAGLEELLYPAEMETDDNGARVIVLAFGAKSARLAALKTDPAEKEELEFRVKQVYQKLGLDPNLKPTQSYQEPNPKMTDSEVGEWLEQNTETLDLVSKTARKPAYFYPLTRTPDDEQIQFYTFLEDVMQSKAFVRGFSARAKHRIAIGDIDGAIDDTIAIFRLGRFSGHQGFLVGALIGIAIESNAFNIEIMGNPEHPPTLEQIARFQKELDNLPPQVTFNECMETERYQVLCSLQNQFGGVVMSRAFDLGVMLLQTNRDFDIILGKTSGTATYELPDKPRLWRMVSRRTRSLEVYKTMSSLLVPAIQAAREAFRRLECIEHLHTLTLAMYRYQLDHGTLPPTFTVDATGKPLQSWRVLLLPYLGEEELYQKIRLDEPWDSEHNRQFHEQLLPVFQCPTNWKSIERPGRTAYSVILGDEMPFDASGQGKPLPIKRDTILLVETFHERNWMDPTNELTLEDAGKKVKVHTDSVGMGSFHAGDMNVARAGGGVHSVKEISDESTNHKQSEPRTE